VPLENSKRHTQVGRVKEGSLSYGDYAALDDGARYELANGTLELMSPAPSPTHQFICAHIRDLLTGTCSEEFLFLLSPIDVILSDKEVRQPDVVAIHRNHVHLITKRGVEGVPDLVVEVVSPSSVKRDRGQKIAVYAMFNIPEYWLVSPEVWALEQYVLDGGCYTLANVYVGDEIIDSHVLRCAAFSMDDVMRSMPELPNA
jgi:Uma2 family endonuclease